MHGASRRRCKGALNLGDLFESQHQGALSFNNWLHSFEQVACVPDRNGEIGAAKVLDYREVDSNHFSVSVEERAARTAGCSRSIVDDLVLKYVADVSLRGGRPDEPLRSNL